MVGADKRVDSILGWLYMGSHRWVGGEVEFGSMIDEMEQSFQVNDVLFLSLTCFDVFELGFMCA